MSKALIAQYYNRLDKLIQFGGTKKETSVRNEFYNLLSHYADKRNLVLVAELPVRGTKGRDVTPDGTLKNVLRIEYGYWESKDESLNLDDEIDKKIKKGYPLNNILFEDSEEAVLIQGGETVMRVNMKNVDELDRILTAFVNHKNPFVKKFEDAIDQFQDDIPTIIETLREKIGIARQDNPNFISVSETFLELCMAEINPDITMADVREMMIQHILTGDIFNKVFGDAEFHRHNNIANELEKLVGTLFDYSERRNLLGSIEHYYDAINTAAASVADHHEKQKFLKALYENFYKAYNPKAADRLGVVYTPNEIVDFMVDSTNFLLEKHFRRQLWDKNVEILDPATGTGTFICSIIDKCPNQYLAHKYKKELHANDVAILPYYVANLNIEYTFKQKMGYYEEFPNICFVDTLDNVAALKGVRKDIGVQTSMFGFSSENSNRIRRQNEKKISVVIGNPPYNANQKNENENNKNREYPAIDKHIKDSFVKHSTAQKTKVYDMYARFYRWAMDRIDANGIIAFITNRSFIDSRTFDGFRQCVENDFAHCYIIDTQSDVRANPKIAGTTHNVFGIQTGVAVMFLVKSDKQKEPCRLEYTSLPDEWRKEEKWHWFRDSRIEKLEFQNIIPDKNHNWINIAENDWDSLMSLKNMIHSSLPAVNTARDEWVFDFSKQNLA
jgi:predicted helicase